MKSLAANGDGVAVLTRHSVESEVDSGQLAVFSLDDPQLVMPLFVTYRAKQQLGRAAAATLELIRGLFAEEPAAA